MKKLLPICFLSLLFIMNTVNAQAIRFTGVKTINYHPEYSEWDNWPKEWRTLEKSEQFTMSITEKVVGKVYGVTLYKNGELIDDATVKFDSEKSIQVRESWNTEYVNCYKDSNGDYIYTQNVSLEQLSKDATPWKEHDSMVYFWLFKSNLGIALR